MRFGVQRQQTLLVTSELVIWRYANAFIFTNQSELDFGIAYVTLGYPTPSSSVINETPAVPQPVKKYQVLYGMRRFIIAFTTFRQLSLS
jgi:hypothetical protein